MKLYSYWQSSTSYRVRIALALKGVPYETMAVNLAAGDQSDPAYTAVNPAAGVPSVKLKNGAIITQSMAILEWLETTHPDPAFLPDDPVAAAQVRAAALVIACDIHPVNNRKVTVKLHEMGHGPGAATEWMNDWMTRGLKAFQALLPKDTAFCFGDTPGLADICLIPQLYNAHRWGCELTGLSRLTDIEARCLDLPAFGAARPERQPDAP